VYCYNSFRNEFLLKYIFLFFSNLQALRLLLVVAAYQLAHGEPPPADGQFRNHKYGEEGKPVKFPGPSTADEKSSTAPTVCYYFIFFYL